MAQDIISDALNMIKNAKNSRKNTVDIKRISNLLIEILKVMKQKGIVKKYKIDSKKKSIEVTLGEFTECRAIKPRFSVNKSQIEKYKRRYLPARNVGTILISTNNGLKTHEEAEEEGLGGSLIAFFY